MDVYDEVDRRENETSMLYINYYNCTFLNHRHDICCIQLLFLNISFVVEGFNSFKYILAGVCVDLHL